MKKVRNLVVVFGDQLDPKAAAYDQFVPSTMRSGWQRQIMIQAPARPAHEPADE